ncbi:hypothetical protein ANN_27819 [Periplaneta americana]|uniref:Uncharacterized protein n=1 Tax=Periplaneta americana TaxID=6978 RepID=A0ABQ8RV95_PERAM|nr:hypothetical protein ANN_27819 [Periplaneta americana]
MEEVAGVSVIKKNNLVKRRRLDKLPHLCSLNCYCYHLCLAGKRKNYGSNEITSALLDTLRNAKFENDCDCVRLCSDGCPGQNKTRPRSEEVPEEDEKEDQENIDEVPDLVVEELYNIARVVVQDEHSILSLSNFEDSSCLGSLRARPAERQERDAEARHGEKGGGESSVTRSSGTRATYLSGSFKKPQTLDSRTFDLINKSGRSLRASQSVESVARGGPEFEQGSQLVSS